MNGLLGRGSEREREREWEIKGEWEREVKIGEVGRMGITERVRDERRGTEINEKEKRE